MWSSAEATARANHRHYPRVPDLILLSICIASVDTTKCIVLQPIASLPWPCRRLNWLRLAHSPLCLSFAWLHSFPSPLPIAAPVPSRHRLYLVNGCHLYAAERMLAKDGCTAQGANLGPAIHATDLLRGVAKLVVLLAEQEGSDY